LIEPSESEFPTREPTVESFHVHTRLDPVLVLRLPQWYKAVGAGELKLNERRTALRTVPAHHSHVLRIRICRAQKYRDIALKFA